jgi:hypothetical protein
MAEPEYEYATAMVEPDGSLWDFYPEDGGETLEHAIEAARRWNSDNEDDETMAPCVVVRRTKPVKAGEWELVAAKVNTLT